jgi:hypothetical protein
MSDFAYAWQDYKKRRLQFFGIWLGGMPVVFALSYGLTTLFHSDAPLSVIADAWMLEFLITSLRLSYVECPRCQEWFFSTWFYLNRLHNGTVRLLSSSQMADWT